MNLKDRDSLTALLKQTKDVFQDISHKIDWSVTDSSYLDDLMNSRELQDDIRSRIMRISSSRALANITPMFLMYKAWQRTKAVYSFSRVFIEDMSQTDDTSLYTSLLDRLPFKDMLFFYPEEAMPFTENEEIAGIFVHLEDHPEHVWVSLFCLDRISGNDSQVLPGIGIGFPIANGTKVSQIFETSYFVEWQTNYRRAMMYDQHLSEQQLEKLLLDTRRILSTTINLMYYLSSNNADIKAIKRQKKLKKPGSNVKEDSVPAVKLHEVGTKYAEIVYRQWKDHSVSTEEDDDNKDDESSEDAERRTVKHGKKRRPHARRAHYQHYWTGKGRTNLEVRWKSDIFVGANRDDQAVIVYDVAKKSLKGKRNPNASKKKQDKQKTK